MEKQTKKKIKIAIIAPAILPIPAVKGGAIETLTTYLIEENERNPRIDFTVFSPFSEEAQVVSRKYNYTRIEFVDFSSYAKKLDDFCCLWIRRLTLKSFTPVSYFMRKVNKCFKDADFDYILLEGNYFQMIQISKRYKDRCILHLHTDCIHRETYRAKETLESFRNIFVISKFLGNSILTVSDKIESKIKLLKNTVNQNYFSVQSTDEFRKSFRKKYGISDDEVVLIFCGRLDPGKGIRELLLAVKDVPNCRLVVVGASWFSSDKQTNFVRELKDISGIIEDRVIYTGYVPHEKVGLYYSVGDIGVFPSTCNEAAGLVIIEAMAVGLPVITTNKGGIPEYTTSDSCILLEVNKLLVNNLKIAITRLLGDSELRLKMSRAALENAKKYNTQVYFDNFCELIDSCQSEKEENI